MGATSNSSTEGDMSTPNTTVPSSPVVDEDYSPLLDDDAVQQLRAEERAAKAENQRAQRKENDKLLKKKTKNISDSERKQQAQQLDELLAKSAAFSDVLTKKTQVLGRVGSGFDGKALGEHNLSMAKQPKIMKGGVMRDYQLEGLTWMFEICSQGMSGILADEMGLGKTIQTISLIALLREQESYLGPHLIVAPLSTLSNWVEEFAKWVPSVPVILYHGTPQQRAEMRKNKILKHLSGNKPTARFPVVCTSYDIILRDKKDLSRINWEFIIIDEGHRLKNFDSALFRELRMFTSATRLLITGTPLQNNLKELWSLLNFLMPTIFTNWEHFESWFDFSDLQDEEGTEEFIADKQKQDLIKKIHLVLQPLLLRRVKADVEHMLPKKREYVLYAPMTSEQRDLYSVMSDKTADQRRFLEDKVVERLTKSQQQIKKPPSRSKRQQKKEVSSDDEAPLKLAVRNRHRKGGDSKDSTPAKANAFEKMMGKKQSPPTRSTRSSLGKRRSNDSLTPIASKSAKSSRASSPAVSIRSSSRRSTRKNRKYIEVDASEEDEMNDDEVEQKWADEAAEQDLLSDDEEIDPEKQRQAKTLELAKKEIATKKLGNPLMQLRLVCNSPHNFFNPWTADSELPIDETLVTHSGKMLLLDRLLPSLFKRGHKVLIFSQFKTQLDIIEDYASDLRGWNVCRIDGSVAQDDRRQQIKDFNTDPEHRLFLLSTRAGGQGINLATADTVILFDSDWNPQQDLQAIDRAHRIGQTRPVVVFRFATKGTVEENLLMSADAKRRLEKLVIKKGGYRNLADKMNTKEELEEKDLRALLEKDGQVFEYTGKEHILSDADLDIICDRSDEAYVRAAKGEGDSEAFRIVETKAEGMMSLGGK